MAAPNTGGQLRTKITDMEVGDYIACSYNNASGAVGTFNFLGDDTKTEIAVTGRTNGASNKFYFVKTDKGLLISDRVIQHSITWNTLNAGEYIQGASVAAVFSDEGSGSAIALTGITGIIRSLGGGNSYASATGTSQTTDAGLGAWPTDNEWDTYIVKKDYGTGAGRDDVWHWQAVFTWAQETHATAGSINRAVRGSASADKFTYFDSSTSASNRGFRPVFEYSEVTP